MWSANTPWVSQAEGSLTECSVIVLQDYSSYLQFNLGNSNCQAGNWNYFELSGFSVIVVFEQKDQQHVIKVVLYLYMLYCKISSNVRAQKQQNKTKQKHEILKYYKVTALQNV